MTTSLNALLRREGWFKQHHDVYALLGLGRKLPVEGFSERVVEGVTFYCKPANPVKRVSQFTGRSIKSSKHRLIVICTCGAHMPFGRMGQHTRGTAHRIVTSS